jgi:hypothetical protein
MTEPQWQARVDIPGNPRRGSGFLVTDRHVLTCEHVIRGHVEVQVTLRDGNPARLATVLKDGPWWSPTSGAADVAVLELREPVAIEPARFAPHSSIEIYAKQALTAYGFPAEYESTGVTSSEFMASPHRLIGHNVQVEAKDEYGVWLQEGFSGAAVYHEATSSVVGMVKTAGRGNSVRIGTIVPVAELARHCPPLDGMIRLGTLSPAAYTELRAALRQLRLPPEKVGQIVASVRTKLAEIPSHLTSLLALVEAMVIETVRIDDAEMRYHLAGLLVTIGTAETRRWAGIHLWHGDPPSPPTIAPTYDGAVLVKLEPSAGCGAEAYDLMVWTVTEADGALSEPIVREWGLTKAQWQDRVEEALIQALSRIPVTVRTVTVEFVLPRGHLTEPVELWANRLDDDTPIGISRPTVVRDLDWFSHDNPADLGRRARMLRDDHRSLGDELRWRDCAQPPGSPVAFKAWLRAGDGPFAVGLTGEWAQAHSVATAVAAGPPVLLWHRSLCRAGDHAAEVECVGMRFRRELAEGLRTVTIDEIAHIVRDLRAEAAYQEDAAHCGSSIVLLRDDARRRQVPLSFAE